MAPKKKTAGSGSRTKRSTSAKRPTKKKGAAKKKATAAKAARKSSPKKGAAKPKRSTRTKKTGGATRQTSLVTVAESERTFHTIEQALVDLWSVVNELSRVRPPQKKFYRCLLYTSDAADE